MSVLSLESVEEMAARVASMTLIEKRAIAVSLANAGVPYHEIAVRVGWKDTMRVSAEMSIARRGGAFVMYRDTSKSPEAHRENAAKRAAARALKFKSQRDKPPRSSSIPRKLMSDSEVQELMASVPKRLSVLVLPLRIWHALYREARKSGAMVRMEPNGDTAFDATLKFQRGE